jgi:hypothetical protein
MKCGLVAEKKNLMSNWYGVYSGKGHVNSMLILLRLFPFHTCVEFSQKHVKRVSHCVEKSCLP